VTEKDYQHFFYEPQRHRGHRERYTKNLRRRQKRKEKREKYQE
jgi:hypothetical protein